MGILDVRFATYVPQDDGGFANHPRMIDKSVHNIESEKRSLKVVLTYSTTLANSTAPHNSNRGR